MLVIVFWFMSGRKVLRSRVVVGRPVNSSEITRARFFSVCSIIYPLILDVIY